VDAIGRDATVSVHVPPTEPLASGAEDQLRVSAEVARLTATATDREHASRDALNGRLAGTITACGALLAAAFALSKDAADLNVGGAPGVLFAVAFVAAVALLVAAILVCLSAFQPEPRHLLNPELVRYWAREAVPDDEARADRFKLDVALLAQLGRGNSRRARRLLVSQRLLVGALLFAGAGALIVFFS
jgi:hypothetical protein